MSPFSLPLRPLVSRGWQWWTGELSSLLPARVLDWFGVGPSRLIFASRSEDAPLRLWVRIGDNTTDLGPIGSRVALADKLSTHPAARTLPVELDLPRDAVIEGTLRMPAAAAEDLQSVVAMQIDGAIPFSKDEIYFAAHPVEATRDALVASVLAIPRRTLDSALQRLTELGAAPRTMTIGGDADATELLPVNARPRAPRTHYAILVVLTCICILLAGAGIAIPLQEKAAVASALAAELGSVRQSAREVQVLSARAADLRGERQVVAAARSTRPPIVRLLSEIAEVLPDDSWLDRIRTTSQGLQLSGYAANAARLIDLFEASPYFHGARFAAPVTMDTTLKRERFDLLISIVGKAPAGSERQE